MKADKNISTVNYLLDLLVSSLCFLRYFIKGVPPVPLTVEPPVPNNVLLTFC